MFLVDFGN